MNSVKRGETIAVRSDSIIEARFSLTAKQNELLDMLLCEIRDDDQYQYTISVDKYKAFYDTDTSNLYRDLKKAVKEFEGKGFRIVNKSTGEEIYYSWFSKIHYKPKKAEIQVNVDLDFKKLLWEVKKKIYYDIKNTLNFNSAYSQRMYYYLKSFEDTGWRVDDIEKLQDKLECPPSYRNFADFKRAVLDVAEKEINTSSDISFSYKPQKTGRKVTRIDFYIKNKNRENNVLDEVAVGLTGKTTDNNTYLIMQVRNVIKESISEDEIRNLLETANNNLDKIKYNYEIMKRQNHVDSVFAWMLRALERDNYKPPVAMQQVGMFNSFEQREYSDEWYENLEKAHMGN